MAFRSDFPSKIYFANLQDHACTQSWTFPSHLIMPYSYEKKLHSEKTLIVKSIAQIQVHAKPILWSIFIKLMVLNICLSLLNQNA
jgi:hypothetical protein